VRDVCVWEYMQIDNVPSSLPQVPPYSPQSFVNCVSYVTPRGWQLSQFIPFMQTQLFTSLPVWEGCWEWTCFFVAVLKKAECSFF